ncbi:flippase [Pedobacter sp. G11]|uniref:flippase n=1 Tax=Pedobacter sp. G11 TaxID=2482728 RepID=UPI000F5E6AB1|nr:flippase [Pedobacter sp. G11]AZI25177.1 flippase [Pedobacter sp. G11]
MSLKKNLISNFLLTASTIVFPLITLPYITRTLSAESIGKVFYVDSFTQYFILFSAIGIPYYGVREIAKIKANKQETSNLVVDLILIQFCLALICCLLFYTLFLFFPKLSGFGTLVEIGCVGIISNAFLIEWYYQGVENFGYITARSLIIKLLSVLTILFFVKQINDYKIYYFILILTVTANAVLNSLNFFTKAFYHYKLERKILRHLKPLWILFSINIAISLYTIMDTIILGSFTGSQEVSFYNIPLKIVKIFWTVMGGIGLVLIPRMSTFFANKETLKTQELMKKSISIVAMLGIPFFVFTILFSNTILTMISGTKYLKAASALQILGIVPLIIGICNVFGTQYLLAIGQERKILYATIVGFIVSIMLNFLLIPVLSYLGSSIACVVAELSVCIVIFLYAKKTICIRVDYQLIKLICSSLAITICTWFILRGDFDHLYLLAISFTVYMLSLLFLNHLVFKNHFINSILRFSIK